MSCALEEHGTLWAGRTSTVDARERGVLPKGVGYLELELFFSLLWGLRVITVGCNTKIDVCLVEVNNRPSLVGRKVSLSRVGEMIPEQ